MDNVEIWFFALGILLTVVTGLLFYFLLHEKALPGFAELSTATVGSWNIHYQMEGQGPALLLVHGLGASLHCWHYLVPLLKNRFTVIALDLPGFGRSSKNIGVAYGLDEQAERIEQFLDHIGVKQCDLVGNSMGGNLCLWLAKRHPLRFPNVIALAPAANPKLVPWLFRRLGMFSRPAAWFFNKSLADYMHNRTLTWPEKLTEKHVQQTLSTYHRNPDAIRTFFAATAAITDPRLLQTPIESRLLVLYGQADRLVPRSTMDLLIDALPSAKLVVHPEGGHQLQEDDPTWTSEQIINFLQPRLDKALTVSATSSTEIH